MAKKRGKAHATMSKPAAVSETNVAGATLKELLQPDVLAKLKAQANELQAAEEQRKEAARKQAEEARKAEQKRLDNDFAHLLANSNSDWRNYK